MYSNDEKKFLEQNKAYRQEIADVEHQIEQVQEQLEKLEYRRQFLVHLVSGEDYGTIEEERPGQSLFELYFGNKQAPKPEPKPEQKPAPKPKARTKPKTEPDTTVVTSNKDVLEKQNKALVRFITNNPGARRSEIADGLKRFSETEIDRTIKRCRSAGLIVSKGRSRATQWFPVES